MCCFHALVPQPERDDGDVNPGLKQVHGRRVPQGIPVLLMICIPQRSATAITRVMEWQSN
jgi:hypothetical protein